MITIKNEEECCGCSSCEQSCPQKCISLLDDSKGFKYPIIDKKHCINCGLCEKVCPVLNTLPKKTPLATYAAKNKNEEVRRNSSSGGLFSLFAQHIIERKGIVIGASFSNKWNVEHTCAENIEETYRFRGSKYVQSDINKSYSKAKYFLDNNRLVLFSGTPCQIQGLYNYLRKDYNNLITIDFACHGVPSPMIWRQWLDKTKKIYNISDIQSISFRYKEPSAKNYSFCLKAKDKSVVIKRNQNSYMTGYLNNLFIRPICFSCPFKGKYASDITISDFWGLHLFHPEFDDKEGINAVLLNSKKGINLFDEIDCESINVEYKEVLKGNPILETSTKQNSFSKRYWRVYEKKGIESLDIIRSNILLKKKIYYPIIALKKLGKHIFKQ